MSQYKLLTVGGNPKIIKSDNQKQYGVKTAILHLSAHRKSGYNVCKSASVKSCAVLCLDHSGRGRTKVVQDARIRKTKLLFESRKLFEKWLYEDIEKFIKHCQKRNLKPAIRLNGTSDLDWNQLFPGIFEKYSMVQFYDYCKIKKRMSNYLDGKYPANYHLTFSRHELNEEYCKEVLKRGGNVAVVFKGQPFPVKWAGHKLISGDEHDLRFTEGNQGLVIGLTAKGRAKHDTTGFVVRPKVNEAKKTKGRTK